MIHLLAAIAAAIWLSPLAPSFPIPARHPRIAHFMPYIFGDSLAALRKAKRLGFRYVDQNGLCDAQGIVWIFHWPKYRKQYRWISTGRHTKRGREIRVRVPKSWPAKVQDLQTSQVERLRSARFRGRKPWKARTHFAEAARLGLVLCLEVKGSPGFQNLATWRSLAIARDAFDAKVVVMTLQNQGGNAAARRRLELAAQHGFPVALLPRGKRPADWLEWQQLGVKQWGRWR